MSRNQTCALAIAGAVLVAAGVFWLRKKAVDPGVRPLAPSTTIVAPAPARPAAAVSVARRAVERNPAVEQSPAPQPAGRPPALFVPRQKRVSREFIAAFRLTPAEASAVQGAFDAAHARVERQAIAHATVSRPAADALVLRIAPFDGTAGLDELFDRLQGILDAKRYRALIGGYDFDIDFALHFFGGETRSIEIKRTPQGRYVMTEERTTPEHLIDGEPVTFPTRADVEGSLGQLASLLPADF